MCATFTFICLIPVDYGNENSNGNSNNDDDDDGDDDDDVDDEDEDDDNNNVQQPSTNSAGPTITGDETSDSSANRINEQIDTNEINGYETQPTEQPAIAIENRNIPSESKSCDVNNGGCEQMCNMVPNKQGAENVVECSCREGFYLDSDMKCLGESHNLFIRLNRV